jgi:hypothetical protein
VKADGAGATPVNSRPAVASNAPTRATDEMLTSNGWYSPSSEIQAGQVSLIEPASGR